MQHLRFVTVPLLIFGASAPVFSQQLPATGKTAGTSVLVNNLKKHIGYLAGDALEGRRTGTAGEMKAVAYLSLQYKKYGLQPLGDHGGYIQEFLINEGREIKKGSFLKSGGQALKLTDEFFPLSFSGNGTIASATWLNLQSALDSNQGNPHFDLNQYIRARATAVALEGKKALVLYNSSKIPDSLSFSSRDHDEPVTIPVVYITVNGMKKVVAEQPLNGLVDLGEKTRKGHNVIAWLDNGAASTVILGGHLDHLGYGEDHNSRNTGAPAIHNGADDNASGTAAVVELARILKGASSQPAYKNNNYLFINFSGEELGLYGSKYFTEHPFIDMNTVNYMINMDMIGRLSDSSQALTVGGVGTASTWGDLLNNGPAKSFTIKVDSSGTGPSDHTSFYRKDIPVLFFFTGLHTDYHKPTDDADKINYAGEASIVNYIAALVGSANARGKLAFLKTKEQSMGTGRFKVSIGIMPDYTFGGQGVRADGVIEGRAAQKAGLKTGDIIVQLGEHLVTGLDTYMQALNRFSKGESTRVIVRRGTEILEMPVTF